MNAKERINYLKKIINKNSYLYYIKQNPEISDNEYDIYFRELIDLETSYPIKFNIISILFLLE